MREREREKEREREIERERESEREREREREREGERVMCLVLTKSSHYKNEHADGTKTCMFINDIETN